MGGGACPYIADSPPVSELESPKLKMAGKWHRLGFLLLMGLGVIATVNPKLAVNNTKITQLTKLVNPDLIFQFPDLFWVVVFTSCIFWTVGEGNKVDIWIKWVQCGVQLLLSFYWIFNLCYVKWIEAYTIN